MPDQKTRNTRRKAPQPNLETIGLEIGKVPPQALDVEEAVLGAMLLEPSCVDAALEELTPSCFYSEKHRMIFDAMSSLVLEHVSVDFITVSSKLKERGDLEAVGGAVVLANLSEANGQISTIHSMVYEFNGFNKEYEEKEDGTSLLSENALCIFSGSVKNDPLSFIGSEVLFKVCNHIFKFCHTVK